MKWILPVFFTFLLVSCQTKAQEEKTFTDVDVTEFAKLMENEDFVVLDVRTSEETELGMIDGAIEIDVKSADFAERISKLDKDKTYLVYCRSGRRSVTACNVMSDQGFTKLYNLLGGYNQWTEEGK